MQLVLKSCAVRSWRTSDAESLVRHADNRDIWINLRDAFPHPYTRRAARDALTAVTAHAIAAHGLTRIYAVPFAGNKASCRVLEKAGYVLEARLRKSAIKDGQIVDQMQYAFVVGPTT
jgi:RimJ/RimL family protein N-acetyltransferase